MQSTHYRPRLREMAQAAGLKRAELAAQIGVDRTTLRAWERGHAPIPDELLDPLADYFGCSVLWLMRWEEWIEMLLANLDENVGV